MVKESRQMTPSYNNKGLVRPFPINQPVKPIKKTMLTDEYLYGKEVEVPVIPEYVIMRRVELLKDHLSELLDQSFNNRSYEDQIKIGRVLRAIDFWDGISKSQ